MGRHKKTDTGAANKHGAPDIETPKARGKADAPAETVTARLLREEREAAERAAAALAAERSKAERAAAERAEREAKAAAEREAKAKLEAERKRSATIAAKKARAAQIAKMFEAERAQIEKTYAFFERMLAAVKVYMDACKRGEALNLGGQYEQTFDKWREETEGNFARLRTALLSRNGLDEYMGGFRYCEALRRERAEICEWLKAQGADA